MKTNPDIKIEWPIGTRVEIHAGSTVAFARGTVVGYGRKGRGHLIIKRDGLKAREPWGPDCLRKKTPTQ